jgi:ketosteroid isomerase-like protein
MAVTPDYVREVFKGLRNGDGAAFFTHVADDVDWIVMGTHRPSSKLWTLSMRRPSESSPGLRRVFCNEAPQAGRVAAMVAKSTSAEAA